MLPGLERPVEEVRQFAIGRVADHIAGHIADHMADHMAERRAVLGVDLWVASRFDHQYQAGGAEGTVEVQVQRAEGTFVVQVQEAC